MDVVPDSFQARSHTPLSFAIMHFPNMTSCIEAWIYRPTLARRSNAAFQPSISLARGSACPPLIIPCYPQNRKYIVVSIHCSHLVRSSLPRKRQTTWQLKVVRPGKDHALPIYQQPYPRISTTISEYSSKGSRSRC